MNTILQRRNKSAWLWMLLWLFAVETEALAQGNYIETTTPLEAVSSIPQGGTVRLSVEKDYYDGLGRLHQTVLQGQSPSSYDLVTLWEYDGLNRQRRQWKAVEIEQSNGAYVDIQVFQQTAQNFHNDSRPFDEYAYEPSALGRMTSLQKAGNEWRNHATNHTYETNTANNVKRIMVQNAHAISYTSNYGIGELYVETTTDEDGVTSSTYIDKRGQKVAQQTANAWTYYVYNDLGQLAYVLPPLVADRCTSATLDENDDLMKKYAYVYKYDEYGRMVIKRLPGSDEVRMVYNASGRLILSQDGNQRERGNYWCAFQYDQYGRKLYSAEILLPAGAEETIRQSQESEVYEDFYNLSPVNPLSDIGYSADPFSPAETKPLLVNYYDNYDFMELLPAGMPDSLDFKRIPNFDQQYRSALGLPTGARVYNLFNEDYSATTYYYDQDGRIIQQHRKLGFGGYEHTYMAYSFSGQPLRVLTIATEYGITIKELYEYTYDHADRLLTTTYKLGNDNPIVLQHFSYTEDGKVSQKQIYNNIDRVNYTYDIQDHITSIQSTDFTENLYYNSLPSDIGIHRRYNGSISAQTWTYGTATNGYSYLYDSQNRLTHAYGSYNGNSVDYLYTEEFAYDKQGNILTLTRWDNEDVRDYLTCSYNGNQLKAVTDNMDAPTGYNNLNYRDQSNWQTEMLYDQNGNLIADSDREICSIRYNILNLPDTIENIHGEKIIHYYDAAGNRLRTCYRSRDRRMLEPSMPQPNASEQPNQFVGSAYAMDGNRRYMLNQYGDWVPDYVFNPEGYTRYYGNIEHFRFYYIKDHLGNVREVYVNPEPGYKECVQRTQYYPSGLPWKEGFAASEQPFKYNGKEFIEMHGLDEYDSEARWYYPAIMRTTTMDPMAEKYYSTSPYAWCGNNPVNYVDPDGRVFDKRNEKKARRYEKYLSRLSKHCSPERRVYIAILQDGIKKMRLDPNNEYQFIFDQSKDGQSKTYGDGKNSQGQTIIKMVYVSKETKANEATHGGQNAKGDITLFSDGRSQDFDLSDETEACRVQIAVMDGTTFYILNDDPNAPIPTIETTFKNPEDLNPEDVLKICDDPWGLSTPYKDYPKEKSPREK